MLCLDEHRGSLEWIVGWAGEAGFEQAKKLPLSEKRGCGLRGRAWQKLVTFLNDAGQNLGGHAIVNLINQAQEVQAKL